MSTLKYLKKGDIVDIIFPSNHPTFKSLKKAKQFIKSLGLIPRIFEEKKLSDTDKDGYIICSNELKLNQLYKALSSKDSKLVWCWAGGYGSGELIQELQKKRKIKQNKFFIGYSDETFLSTFLQQKWGWKTLYAPMLSDMISNKKSEKSKKDLINFLFEKQKKSELKLKLLNKIKIRKHIKSKIIGGCLSMILANFGTKNQINCKNKILFLEDVGESDFRLLRRFNQIADYIIDNKQTPKAILLGDFTTSNNKTGSNEKKFLEIIKKLDEKLQKYKIKIPIFHSKKLGHTEDMYSLVLGENITIANQNNQIILV